MASVMTSGSVSKAGRPAFGGSEECSSFHQSSTNTYNETKKESRSSMAPSFGESLVHQHTILAPSLFFAITHQTSKGPGAMGVHAINHKLLQAQFPKGKMDPEKPPVLLLGQKGKVMGLEWEAAD